MNNTVYVFPYDTTTDRPNIAYLQGDTSSLLIDAGGGPKTWKYLQTEFSKYHLEMPENILLTHYHWDHSFGIGYSDAIIYASSYTNEKLKEHIHLHPASIDDIISDELQPKFCREHLLMEYPDISTLQLKEADKIISTTKIDLGNRIVDIYEVPSPHTPGSLIAFDHNSRYLFIGDADCGYIKGMDFYDDPIKLQGFLTFIKDIPFTHVVGGHFDVVTKDEYLADFPQI